MPYNANRHILIAKALGASQGVPLDARSYFYDELLFIARPYQSTAEVFAYLPKTVRKGHFPVFINEDGVLEADGSYTGGTVDEWWFRDGIEDYHLVKKLYNSSPVILPTTTTTTTKSTATTTSTTKAPTTTSTTTVSNSISTHVSIYKAFVTDNPTVVVNGQSYNFPPNNLLIAEDFENDEYLLEGYHQYAQPHSFNLVPSPTNPANQVARIELRDTDPTQSGGTRVEILFPEQESMERWYSFMAYFPSADYLKDSYTEIINQWHQGGGLSPGIALEVKNDRYEIVIPSGASGEGNLRIDIAPMQKNIWNRFVWHIKHYPNSSGLIELWINDIKVFTRNGSCVYDITTPPRWKLGIYKWKWNDTLTTDTTKRVIYYDNVKMGNENANYDLMNPITSGNLLVFPNVLTKNVSYPVSASNVSSKNKPLQIIANGDVAKECTTCTSLSQVTANAGQTGIKLMVKGI